MSIIFSVLAAIGVFSAYLLLDGYLTNKRRRESLHARLNPLGTANNQAEEAVNYLSGTPSASAQALLGFLQNMGFASAEARQKIDRRFAQAGIDSADGSIYYLAAERIGGPIILLLGLLLALTATPQNALLVYSSALLICVLGIFGPRLYLQNTIDKRKHKLRRAFPDTLDLLLICVESGLALDAALARVCTELGRAYPEMTSELNRTRLELALINDRVRALTNLGERTDMPAFRSLISSLIQSERFGTSLTDTLRILSEEFRVQRLADAEVKAARLPVIMTVPLIFMLMPALMLIVLGPAIVSIQRSQSSAASSR